MVKEYRAKLAAALKRRGVSLDIFLKANNETAFGVATLFQNVKAIDEGKAPLSAEKRSSHPVKLTDEQWDVVAGAILLGKKKTDLQWIVTWIEADFAQTLAFATMSRYIHHLQLSFPLIAKYL